MESQFVDEIEFKTPMSLYHHPREAAIAALLCFLINISPSDSTSGFLAMIYAPALGTRYLGTSAACSCSRLIALY